MISLKTQAVAPLCGKIDEKLTRRIYVLKEILWTILLALLLVFIPFGVVI